jgi:hypothetical protein
MNPVSLIGGVGMTRVDVYSQSPAPDGRHSGCPHLHALCDEAYYVLEGSGEVEFFDAGRGFRRLALRPGTYVHFPPLVLHRIICTDGLAILGIMGNAGLAENGDARIYFGGAADRDPALYETLRSLPARNGLEGALQRRDAAVRAYLALLALWENDRPQAVREFETFRAAHLQKAKSLQADFEPFLRDGPLHWGQRTLERMRNLPEAFPPDPAIACQHPSESVVFGMCGLLHPVQAPSLLEASA